jgi:hypothetical protein
LTLTARQGQLLRGWIAMLDVDLDLAQQMLRLPPARWPVPPIAVPAVTTEDWDGSLVELVAAIPPPAPDEPAPVARPTSTPRGAYARRARKAAP